MVPKEELRKILGFPLREVGYFRSTLSKNKKQKEVIVEGKTRKRHMFAIHHPDVVWINTFGLPPSMEFQVYTWKNFSSTAEITLDGEKIEERLEVLTDEGTRMHHVTVTWETDKYYYFEDWNDAPRKVICYGLFNSGYVFRCVEERNAEFKDPLLKELTESVTRTLGKPNDCIVKKVTSHGRYPHVLRKIYSALEIDFNQLTNANTTLVELAYGKGRVETGGPRETKYLKFLSVSGKIFVISEKLSPPKEVEWRGTKKEITERYESTIFKLRK